MWPEKIKRQLFYWFGFTRKEAEGFLFLLMLMVVAVFIPLIVNYMTADVNNLPQVAIGKIEAQEIAQLKINSRPYTAKDNSPIKSLTPFPFDPNTINRDSMLALGVGEKLAKGWLNYRSKGGRFKVKSDFSKLYGLQQQEYEQLEPYIQLPDTLPKKVYNEEPKSQPRPGRQKPKFDLNTADSAQLIEVYGIGQGLSRRIIRYRERLGGFISYDQLFDVFGLDTVVVERLQSCSFIAPNFIPRKVYINRLNDDNFSMHPYLGKKLSRILANYKMQHGAYKRPEDLLKTSLITPEKLEKLRPYLDFAE
jgi:DNA uptake protein ComE-like DNA-binding protein